MSQENEINLDHILAPENQLETVALARALCPFAEQATDATMLICVALVESGGSMKEVADYLGYELSRLRGHCQSHQFNRIIRELTKHKLTGAGYLTAVTALMDVSGSKSASPAARANASRTLIEMNEAEEARNGGGTGDGKALNEMTLQELEDHVNKIKADIASLPGQVPALPHSQPCTAQDAVEKAPQS